jgi:hypothetical protein
MPRLAFTLALAAAVIGVGAVSGTAWHPLDPQLARHVAFAPIDLRTGSWHRLLSSVVFVGGPAAFWKVLALIVVSCGAYEWRRGTRAVAVGFAFTHLATLLLSSAVTIACAGAGQAWAAAMIADYDVGPSAGCYGCFGMLLGEASVRWRLLLIGGYAAVTAVNLALHVHSGDVTELGSDAVHGLAILCGWACRPRAAPRLIAAET